MSQPFDASRSLTTLEQDSTIVAVIEMSQSKWLVAIVPGVERQPLKRLDADEAALLKVLHRWRNEAGQAGRQIKRIVVAYEAGRDGFWLARWLRARGVEAYVIHPASIAVSREHRRAKTDRLDTELLIRVFLGWLRGDAAWWRSLPLSRRTRDGRTASEVTWLPSNADRQPNQGRPRPLRYSHFSADTAQGRGKARKSAHHGRSAVAGEHTRGAGPLLGAATGRT
jgi:hypothetical protein